MFSQLLFLLAIKIPISLVYIISKAPFSGISFSGHMHGYIFLLTKIQLIIDKIGSLGLLKE